MALAAPAPLAIATSAMSYAQQQQATSSSAAAISPPRCGSQGGDPTSASAACREMFPLRLHALLADPTVRDVISWLPHGRTFVVLRPDVFANCVLPRYFVPQDSGCPMKLGEYDVARCGQR